MGPRTRTQHTVCVSRDQITAPRGKNKNTPADDNMRNVGCSTVVRMHDVCIVMTIAGLVRSHYTANHIPSCDLTHSTRKASHVISLFLLYLRYNLRRPT
jgi:hypothetical protein